MKSLKFATLLFLVFGCGSRAAALGAEAVAESGTASGVASGGVVSGGGNAAERGFDRLVNQPFLPADFPEEVFDNVWQVWPKPLRQRAEMATPAERRQMAFARYGLTPRPAAPESDLPGDPLQYVVTHDGQDGSRLWTMNCLSCHGGTVYGQPYPGAPNNRFALQTMTEELRATKLKLAKPLSRMDIGSLLIPLGTTHGTTNAVIFGVGLMTRRDADLNVIDAVPESLVHHDMDAPPWWHFYKRPYLYIDGFAERGHRGLMQFTLVPENGPEFYRRYENDFKDIYAYLMSLRPPKYPLPIDESLAERGEQVFQKSCASCHGSYSEQPSYPNVCVPVDEIGTDPVRLQALPAHGRQKYAESWFAVDAEGNRQTTIIDPDGYVAPPLDGVWASAPYFHNGSVPTLWQVLNPKERSAVWIRSSDELNAEQVGLTIRTVDRVPLTETDIAVRRQYFDTRRPGKSNAGHTYPDALTADEKQAVLEYLKTL